MCVNVCVVVCRDVCVNVSVVYGVAIHAAIVCTKLVDLSLSRLAVSRLWSCFGMDTHSSENIMVTRTSDS